MIVLSSAPYSASVSAIWTTVDMRWPIATYTDTRPLSRLLMIVSIAIAVLPVWRSPMISSRWPRPIGIIASIAFRPVWTGSRTGWRWTTPGALNSAGRRSVVLTSPFPSSGRPSGSTIRPSSASPTGMSSSDPVRLTVSPSTTFSQSPNITVPTLSDSRFSARPVTPCGNSSISNDMQFSRPCTRAMPSATDSTVPTSVSSALPESSPSMRLLRMLVISSGLICISSCQLPGWLGSQVDLATSLLKLLKAVLDRRVEDRVADPEHDAAQDVRIDLARQLQVLPRLLPDLLAELLGDRGIECDRARDLDRQQPVLDVPQHVELPPRTIDDRHPVILDQELEEVDERLVGVDEGAPQALLLLLGREVRREEEDRELAVLLQRVRELAELLLDRVELAVLLRDLEQGARIDLCDLLHYLPSRSPDRAEKSSSPSASSTSRRWSLSSSVLRVTFSVASTVRSATSLRISWIARRVSASTSRRVCSSSSSRWCRAASSDSRWCSSAALRARWTISSDCARASRRRWRYSSSSFAASACARSAAAIASSIARWRLSSASWILGNAYVQDPERDARTRSASRSSGPRSGETRKFPLSDRRERDCVW